MPWSAIKVNGLGVIAFPVYSGCKYIVNANGSKITAAGFAFSTKDDLTIKSEDTVIYGNGETAINTVKANVENNAAIYNIAGQKVAKDYKGLVIKNGKKMIQK